jgi:Ca2+-binding EF-hand superfamily protein
VHREIKKILTNLPTVVDEEEADLILKEVDANDQGLIDYKKFSKMIFAPMAVELLPPATVRNRHESMA